jgi:hypothetical protein
MGQSGSPPTCNEALIEMKTFRKTLVMSVVLAGFAQVTSAEGSKSEVTMSGFTWVTQGTCSAKMRSDLFVSGQA